ncbi:N-acetylmuramidase domain-containing protein [Archangium sp.]|uniref:N-acetylmuramidase domain-containing protein n=1 Tax=Archangium sp. TaxID=1872627 RepID=UPI00286ACEC3|nr:N-acetylmuramidase domain-containing protein [Archangium sp.]
MTQFIGAATPLTAQGIEACAHKLSVQPADIWTVLRVEARGCGYFADRRPVILFERHIFSRRTQGRFDAQAPDISNRKAGGYAGGVAEYQRLERAMALDAQAALESASWGMAQVMGFHANDLGYGTADSFVRRMMTSEDEQLGALASYILRNDLAKALRDHDWATFARGYNGSGYEKNQYDKKLADAYKHLTTHALPDLNVREGQLRLLFLGFDPGGVDGALGPNTTGALKRFQSQQHLPTTSNFDAATLEALRQQQALLPRSEAPPETQALATRPPAPVVIAPVTPSTPVPVTRVALAAPEPVRLEVPAAVPTAVAVEVEDAPLPAQLSEQLRQRLTQPLDKVVQDELARLLVLRGKAARELGPTAVQTVDLGLSALLGEQPNLSFVRGIRRRIASAVADQLYPLRPLPILRSSSPAIQVVLGLALLLLVANGGSAFAYRVLSSEQTLLFGLPLRTLLLVGLCGAIGSAVSMLTRLGDFEKPRGASRTSMLMLGFFKPVVGMYSALFCFALMKSGLLPLQAASPGAELYLYMSVCFLVGFSERLAQDMFARAEESFSSASGKARPASPPPAG